MVPGGSPGQQSRPRLGQVLHTPSTRRSYENMTSVGWGRRDSNPHDRNGQRIFILPPLSRPPALGITQGRTLRIGPSLYPRLHVRVAPVGPLHLPACSGDSTAVRAGLAQDCHVQGSSSVREQPKTPKLGFPEFESFHLANFFAKAQFSKSVASTIPPRPHNILPRPKPVAMSCIIPSPTGPNCNHRQDLCRGAQIPGKFLPRNGVLPLQWRRGGW